MEIFISLGRKTWSRIYGRTLTRKTGSKSLRPKNNFDKRNRFSANINRIYNQCFVLYKQTSFY